MALLRSHKWDHTLRFSDPGNVQGSPPRSLTATYTVPATAVTGAVTSTSSTAATSATSTPSSMTTAAKSGGLSTGAEAGIGVGCAIAGLLVIGFIVWFLMRRRRQRREATTGRHSEAPKAGPFTDYKAGGGVGPMNGYGNASPSYQSAYTPQTPAPQYASPQGYEYNSFSPLTAGAMAGGGVYKNVSPAEGMSASLGGARIDGMGANGTLVQEKMSENVASTQPQEMEGGEETNGIRRGRSVRYELE